MSDESIELPQVDSPPQEWVDAEDPETGGLSVTEDEAEEGRRLGNVIDPDDDDDNGLG